MVQWLLSINFYLKGYRVVAFNFMCEDTWSMKSWEEALHFFIAKWVVQIRLSESLMISVVEKMYSYG